MRVIHLNCVSRQQRRTLLSLSAIESGAATLSLFVRCLTLPHHEQMAITKVLSIANLIILLFANEAFREISDVTKTTLLDLRAGV